MFKLSRYRFVLLATLIAFSALTGCGGGSGGTGSSTTYTIGGNVSGLTGTGLILRDLNSDDYSVSANGPFTFKTAVAVTGLYFVTVAQQPSTPSQTCTVANGNGTTSAMVTNVQVVCVGGGLVDAWTWISGDPTVGSSGNHGAQGVSTAVAQPGGRRAGAVTWTDGRGNLWLFGGYGDDDTSPNPTPGYFNDLWKFSGGQWTWVSGDSTSNQWGVYGDIGIADADNIPGARNDAVSWIDSSGNLWLFGGYGYDVNGTLGYLNDLWVFSGGKWIWKSGDNTVNQAGVYGTKGTAAPGNKPGARNKAVKWTDVSGGTLWLFGGSSSPSNYLNDMWKYSISSGQWTSVSGDNTFNQAGTYGTKNTAANDNIPGARDSAVSWISSNGTLWLFGGHGYDSIPTLGYLNDLWTFSGGQWTWVSGDDTVNLPGIYGDVDLSKNKPGARHSVASWIDGSGNLWLFGGEGYDEATTFGYINDLWKYNVGTKQWTWVSGDKLVSQTGTYGTEGTPHLNNIPGARATTASWFDSRTGLLWLFGGDGFDETTQGYLNDLWNYAP